jgi:DNA (cytosine-5)-methyltransferase 1
VIGSLFSGIGGIELGLERAGLGPVAWQVEVDVFCRGVLATHWPRARRFDDVRRVGAAELAPVDLICGGFPCQDVSAAGRGAGIDGERSGLWREFRRVVEELAPRIVVVENVASGKRRWMPAVRGDLHVLGYRSVAVEVSAFDVGSPQRRARVFVVASNADRDAVWLDEQRLSARRARGVRDGGQAVARGDGGRGTAADATRERRRGGRLERPVDGPEQRAAIVGGDRRGDSGTAADAPGEGCGARGLARGRPGREARPAAVRGHGESDARVAADADGQGQLRRAEGDRPFWLWARDESGEQWTALAPVCGVAHGVPRRLDRLRALGNAVVPQCAEAVGRMIAEGLSEVEP